jgi:anti-sigma B factor antagonist
LIGCVEDTVWVRVIGRGTFQNSGGFKDYARKLMRKGYARFVVDLAECDLMDSTFMGMLAGLALHLKEDGRGSLQVTEANPRNAGLLSNLGLDQIFVVFTHEDPGAPRCPAGRAGQTPTELPSTPADSGDMLEAHQKLVEADAANAVRFQDVIELLEKETGENDS